MLPRAELVGVAVRSWGAGWFKTTELSANYFGCNDDVLQWRAIMSIFKLRERAEILDGEH